MATAAVHETVAWFTPTDAVTPVGAEGAAQDAAAITWAEAEAEVVTVVDDAPRARAAFVVSGVDGPVVVVGGAVVGALVVDGGGTVVGALVVGGAVVAALVVDGAGTVVGALVVEGAGGCVVVLAGAEVLGGACFLDVSLRGSTSAAGGLSEATGVGPVGLDGAAPTVPGMAKTRNVARASPTPRFAAEHALCMVATPPTQDAERAGPATRRAMNGRHDGGSTLGTRLGAPDPRETQDGDRRHVDLVDVPGVGLGHHHEGGSTFPTRHVATVALKSHELSPGGT